MTCPASIEIIVPARNEAHRLPQGLEALCQKAATLPLRTAILVVDSASSDSTGDIVRQWPELILPVAERGFPVDVIGRGPGAAALSGAIGPGLAGTVRLHGFLPESGKQAVVAASLLHLNTSQGEGWGLCVLEAAALGVPTVAYDVDGLRDAVRDGKTGWLVREGEQLADVVERAVKELASPARRAQVAADCRDWAARLSWDRSTARMAQLIGASLRAGTSRGTRTGAWIVSGNDDGGEVVAEGPVLDMLVSSGGKMLRPATPAERLLGEVAGPAGPP